MNGSLDNPDQPDMDAIKMFVGQIPRSWSEDQLRELFESYGAVYEINVLRDRSQNPPQSKGECLLATRLSYVLALPKPPNHDKKYIKSYSHYPLLVNCRAWIYHYVYNT